MALLFAGVCIFFAAHLSPGVLGLKQTLVNRLGENLFRGLYIASSVLGMVLIIAGKALADYVHVWNPPAWGRMVAPALIATGFVLFAALLLPTNLRRLTRHPMLWGVSFWSAGHLLANGDLASMLLFGSFGLYALISMYSLNKRGAQKTTARYTPLNDVAVVVAGLVACAAIIWLHPWLFGVTAIY